jgi:hypothetical protein
MREKLDHKLELTVSFLLFKHPAKEREKCPSRRWCKLDMMDAEMDANQWQECDADLFIAGGIKTKQMEKKCQDLLIK